jgi:periplasmic protein TonB
MPRDLFGDVVHPQTGLRSRKWYTLPLSVAAHAAILAAAIVVPLTVADVLPMPPSMVAFIAEAAPPPPPPPPPPPSARRERPLLTANPGVPPVEAPTGFKPDLGLEPESAAGKGVEGGLPNGVEGSGALALVEPPPPPPPAAPTAPIRISSGIRQPTKLHDALPVYPTIAQSARVQGTVILEAIVGVDGRVKEARVLRSIPLLDQAALDAVRQWVYTPTLLNGVPVPIVMTVTVTFTLR